MAPTRQWLVVALFFAGALGCGTAESDPIYSGGAAGMGHAGAGASAGAPSTGGTGQGGTGQGGGTAGSAASSGAGTGPVGHAPIATINHPGDGEVRAAGSEIPFVGLATDPEDGALTGASLAWTSDLAGTLGEGEQFDYMLEAGTHRITLTATDSDGNPGADAITLIIE